MEPSGITVNMVAICEEYYNYLVECSTRLKILQDIRIRDAESVCQFGKPNVMDGDLVLGGNVPNRIDELIRNFENNNRRETC